jgi:porin
MKILNSLLSLAIAAGTVGLARAGTATTSTDVTVAEESSLQEWWNGKYLTGNWFGVRDTLEDHGFKFSGKYYGAFFGVIKGSGAQSRGFWDQGLEFGAEQNFGKLFKVEALEGVKGFGQVRWRDSRADADPNSYVQASSMFNPSNWVSGTQWRLLSAGLEIGTAGNLPVKDMIVLRGGWLQPQKEFVDQPLSKLFLNNAVNSAKGIGGNIPFSSSFSTWGGTLNVKPVDVWYVKGGLFMAYPEATASSNHGLAMEGFAQDPIKNGLMAMAETGITPKFGASELPGKYAFGGYYWGNDKASYYGQNYEGQWGLYWQADQMLFREASPEPEPMGKGPSDGKSVASDSKSFKEPVSTEKPKLSDQGLSTFNLISFAPKYNNTFPFYFQTGLVYTGLIPTRDKDLTMVSLGYGSYSFYQIETKQEAGNTNQQNYTGIIEGGYRFQVNGFAFLQPFAQYIFRPNGTGALQNAAVLGLYTGVNF